MTLPGEFSISLGTELKSTFLASVGTGPGPGVFYVIKWMPEQVLAYLSEADLIQFCPGDQSGQCQALSEQEGRCPWHAEAEVCFCEHPERQVASDPCPEFLV